MALAGQSDSQRHDRWDRQVIAPSSSAAPDPSTPTSQQHIEPLGHIARILFVTLGWICYLAGHVISLVPKLRATLFVIAAHWCFLQSSPRWQGWLYRHPKHGDLLQDWHQYQRVPRSIKASATITLIAGASFIGLSFGRLPLVAFGLFVCLPIACFLWTRPVTPD